MELAVKYIAWAIAVAVPLIGSWFFVFTETDNVTHRKKITPVGKIALALTVVGVVLGLWQTIAADISEHNAAIESFKMQRKTERFRTKMNEANHQADYRLSQIESLLRVIDENSNDFDRGDLDKVAVVAKSFHDYAAVYPDLYDRIQSTSSSRVIVESFSEGIVRNGLARFRDTSECAAAGWENPFGERELGQRSWNIRAEDLLITLRTQHDKSLFEVFNRNLSSDARSELDFSKGLRLYFKYESFAAPCEIPTSNTNACRVNLSETKSGSELLLLLKSEKLKALEVGLKGVGEKFEIDDNLSSSLNRASQCIQM